MTEKKQGFAAMTPEQHREVASKGGKAAHAQGKAHKWTAEEASQAGMKSAKGKTVEHFRAMSRSRFNPALTPDQRNNLDDAIDYAEKLNRVPMVCEEEQRNFRLVVVYVAARRWTIARIWLSPDRTSFDSKYVKVVDYLKERSHASK